MYLVKPHDRQWVCDIETDSLTPTVIWVCCCRNAKTGEEVTLVGNEQIKEWFDRKVDEGCVFVFHNGIKFDVPTLNRLAGCRIPLSRVIDTFLMSMLYSPSIPGGHSLDAWGDRLKYPKGDFHDFEGGLTDEMIEYCIKDVRLGTLVFHRLIERMINTGFTERGCEIEHLAWELMRQQHKNGFKFNQKEAVILYAKLQGILDDLRKQIYEFWPPELKPITTYKKSHRIDGSRTKDCERHLEQYPKVEFHDDGTYTVHDWVEFNLASPQQRVEKLLALGWQPLEFTKAGNPQPTDKGELSPSLVAFVEESGKHEVKLLANWLAMNGRASMLNTWLENYNESTGCIHGNVWLANSLRYRHSDPNSANIPAVRLGDDKKPLFGLSGAYTYEARDLWTTRDPINRRLVGVDAKGIQLRVLANYLNNPAFTEAVLNGDPHSYNQEIGGFRTRAIAKTFIYAFLLGVGDAKAGKIIGGSTRDGREVKARFIDNFPGLRELLERLKGDLGRSGRIKLCDGTPVIVNSDHKVLGYLLQGDESRILRQAKIYAARAIRREALDVLFVGDIHDEWQNDVFSTHVERFTSICEESFAQAGRFFNYNLPIDCDAKVGLTWAETH